MIEEKIKTIDLRIDDLELLGFYKYTSCFDARRGRSTPNTQLFHAHHPFASVGHEPHWSEDLA